LNMEASRYKALPLLLPWPSMAAAAAWPKVQSMPMMASTLKVLRCRRDKTAVYLVVGASSAQHGFS